jgi:Trk-type K+ transport systems, membrane components
MGIFEGLRQASFQTASVMTTTGFATADFAQWPHFSQAILLVLMVVGASAGSTGGGLKVIRLLVLFKYTYRRIQLTFNPNAVIPIKIGGYVISDKLISRSVGLTILYFATLWAGFLVMSAIGLDFVTALSSITSCLGNVGPALGTVGPMASYADIPGTGKLVLLTAMLVGRIELFTLLVLFIPAFWRWR